MDEQCLQLPNLNLGKFPPAVVAQDVPEVHLLDALRVVENEPAVKEVDWHEDVDVLCPHALPLRVASDAFFRKGREQIAGVYVES